MRHKSKSGWQRLWDKSPWDFRPLGAVLIVLYIGLWFPACDGCGYPSAATSTASGVGQPRMGRGPSFFYFWGGSTLGRPSHRMGSRGGPRHLGGGPRGGK